MEGIGEGAVRCKVCSEDVATFKMVHGYTIAFNEDRDIGITLNKEAAEKVAKDAKHYMAILDISIQNPAALLAPSDMVGTVARLRPFLGQCVSLIPQRSGCARCGFFDFTF